MSRDTLNKTRKLDDDQPDDDTDVKDNWKHEMLSTYEEEKMHLFPLCISLFLTWLLKWVWASNPNPPPFFSRQIRLHKANSIIYYALLIKKTRWPNKFG